MPSPARGAPPYRTHSPGISDPIGLFLDATMSGGTSLLVGPGIDISYQGSPAEDYLLLKSEVILEYERTIADLRLQLLHYKRLVARLISPHELEPDYTSAPGLRPLDASSARVVSSIVRAHVPESSVFCDFEEEEL